MKNRKTRSAMRRMLFTLALVLVVAVASVGGTIAWLKAETTPVVNTFTVGDINITLTETTGETYKVIPGKDITKDPKVTVLKGSEACWLFVKVEKNNKWNNNLSFEIADGWTELMENSGIYYRSVEDLTAATDDKDFPVLKGDKVTVANTLTKGEITTGNEPKLTFTAYAIQKEGTGTVAEAWAKIGA